MDYAIVILVSLFAGALTLITGFGLGTILLPVFAMFFPAPVAVAATAVVHLVNNLSKLALVGKWIDTRVLVRFGIPAMLAAVHGALLLDLVGTLPPLTTYTIAARTAEITPVALVIGLLVIVFGILELRELENKGYYPKFLPLGGVLSGFFGGLSGHQGALRSAFLIRAGLDKNEFVGTAAACSTLVDVARLLAYWLGSAFLISGTRSGFGSIEDTFGLIAAACIAGFLGAFVGKRLIKKIRLETIRLLIGITLIIIGVLMATGITTALQPQ